MEHTIHECRGCGNLHREGNPSAAGWKRILHIDGPNLICFECVTQAEYERNHCVEESVIQSFKEDGYENACIDFGS